MKRLYRHWLQDTQSMRLCSPSRPFVHSYLVLLTLSSDDNVAETQEHFSNAIID
jgi:hypothetical protein